MIEELDIKKQLNNMTDAEFSQLPESEWLVLFKVCKQHTQGKKPHTHKTLFEENL